MFRTERFFAVENQHTGSKAWFLLTREGRRGPFSSKVQAQIALQEFISQSTKQASSSRRTRKL